MKLRSSRRQVRRRRRSPEFSAWLAVLKRGPVCPRWKSFSAFYADNGPRPSWRHLMLRTDPSLPFEPGNARATPPRAPGAPPQTV
jgi:hypothetical protein